MCSFQDCLLGCEKSSGGRVKYDLRAASGGFTLVEIIVVIVIIAIAAMMIVPLASSAASIQIRSAANIVGADLEYAKSMAISRGRNYAVIFNTSGESYQIEEETGTGTWALIKHPVKKGFDYVVDFSSDSRLDKVDISSVDFDPGSSSTITFDYLGSPYSGLGTASALNSGVISLAAGGGTTTISVEPLTGFISISSN